MQPIACWCHRCDAYLWRVCAGASTARAGGVWDEQGGRGGHQNFWHLLALRASQPDVLTCSSPRAKHAQEHTRTRLDLSEIEGGGNLHKYVDPRETSRRYMSMRAHTITRVRKKFGGCCKTRSERRCVLQMNVRAGTRAHAGQNMHWSKKPHDMLYAYSMKRNHKFPEWSWIKGHSHIWCQLGVVNVKICFYSTGIWGHRGYKDRLEPESRTFVLLYEQDVPVIGCTSVGHKLSKWKTVFTNFPSHHG
jgi:hypothetical protein